MWKQFVTAMRESVKAIRERTADYVKFKAGKLKSRNEFTLRPFQTKSI